MAKQTWKAGNMVYPLPAVMVSCADKDGNQNIITVAWTGTVCTNPAMAYISVRPERHSYQMIRETGEFVIEDEKGNVGLKLDSGGLSVINDLITRNEKNYVMMRVKEFLLDKDAFFVNL